MSKSDAYGILVGKSEAKIVLDRPSCGWEDNIKRDFQKIGWEVRTGFMWLRIEIGG
jgi:hypothetical protein